jgi:hypothetical protein
MEKYKEAFGDNYEITMGKKGLLNQLRFISNYYPKGKPIVRMDDDVKSVFEKVGGKGSHKKREINLSEFFTSAFRKLKDLNFNLWGVNKVSNPFLMTPGYSTDLRLIVGPINGYINQKEPKYDYKINNSVAEDIEKTIIYYKNDGGVLRFNDVGFTTKAIINEGGIATELGGLKKRLEIIKSANRSLESLYKPYGEIVPNKLQGEVFSLYRNPKVRSDEI